MNILKVVFVMFFISLFVRFLYFPSNIYFGYDQARDGFAALNILSGDLKIIGPTTTFQGLNHGVLYWYILAPFYLLAHGNPEIPSMALRIFNGLGVLLIFYISKILFGKKEALIAAFLFAFSFEQTQFAIYMGNPALGVLSVTLMYLGLALVIFKKTWIGLPLAFLGLGASIQFQFALFYLAVPLFLTILMFRQNFLKLPVKTWVFGVLTLFISLFSFILAEFKYDFRAFHALINLTQQTSGKSIANILNTYFYTLNKMVSFNLSGSLSINSGILILLLILFLIFIKNRSFQKELIFLGIWFFSLFIIFLINGGVENSQNAIPLYYPNVGVSVSLLIFSAFLIGQIFSKSKTVALFVIGLIMLSNLNMINQFNPKGTILEINAQPEMLLQDEIRILDYVYNDASGKPFAVKAITMPLDINTTWSYLFEWYGKEKFKYLPVWNGKNALGFYGNLLVQTAQENLPDKRYVIIEPTRGIPFYLIDDFFKEEGYFTKTLEKREFGKFKVERRMKI